MKQWLISCWENTNEMPEILGLLSKGGMLAGPVLLFVTVSPIFSEWHVNGQAMTYSEFWQSGLGLTTAIYLTFCSVGIYGIAAKKLWSRWLLTLTPFVGTFTFFNETLTTDLLWLLSNCIITSGIIYWYLFYSKAVNRYLEIEC